MLLINVLIFIVVLGVLIFFHEMGHFLAAKACGIYVDRFSLGMPPRLAGIRIGETDYCIGALPIGGYVKMAGQEDTPLSEEEREKDYGHVPPERWYSHKPVWQRMIVITAGPFMNLVLGIILYGIVAAKGTYLPESEISARIGFVKPDSPAASAPLYRISDAGEAEDLSHEPESRGWRTGDWITSIDGKSVHGFSDVSFAAILGAGKTLDVLIERDENNGRTRYLSPIEPELLDGGERTQFGIAPFQKALIDLVLPDLPAAEAGLQAGDIIQRINGQVIDTTTFVKFLENLETGDSVLLDVQRGDENLSYTLYPTILGRLEGIAIYPSPYSEEENGQSTPPTIAYVTDEAAERTGLRRGDVILEVNGEPATAEMIREAERNNVGKPLTLKVQQKAVLAGLRQRAEIKTVEVTPEPVGQIGIVWGHTLVFHQVPSLQVPPAAVREGYSALSKTVETLVMLFAGTVQPKDLGGPVLIYQATTTAASMGLMVLLKITAFISVNLCVFNLLPLPVLDGGHLLFLTWEGIRRKPLPLKTQERVQQVGLVLIVSLLLFVTYNDILRWLASL
ncbi:MAG: RIP metalloprotease RseP [Candidatus Hydrogenedentales bacterium]|jgi:regulator of sigma E protease